MGMTRLEIIAEIDALLTALGAHKNLVSNQIAAGKMYEAWVLAHSLEHLAKRESFQITFVGGNKLKLKASPGPINNSYPHFEGFAGGRNFAMWTDIEFSTLSYSRSLKSTPPIVGSKHELDIIAVPVGTKTYPSHDEILWGIECKHTKFEKHMARAALGVRRELSLLRSPQPMALFRHWPRKYVPADPPSAFTVYSTSPAVTNYRDAGDVFGIDFLQLPLPK